MSGRIGATGRYPFGKADASDEGELAMAVMVDHRNGIVRVEFGKPIGWLGIPSVQARELAAILIEKADELDRRKS